MAKILIVDDSLTQLCSLKSIVEDEGHEVITAEDGEHCLHAAQSQDPDLILLDTARRTDLVIVDIRLG